MALRLWEAVGDLGENLGGMWKSDHISWPSFGQPREPPPRLSALPIPGDGPVALGPSPSVEGLLTLEIRGVVRPAYGGRARLVAVI